MNSKLIIRRIGNALRRILLAIRVNEPNRLPVAPWYGVMPRQTYRLPTRIPACRRLRSKLNLPRCKTGLG